jgi:DNA repair exonuclease SbcCD ATPase subunit
MFFKNKIYFFQIILLFLKLFSISILSIKNSLTNAKGIAIKKAREEMDLLANKIIPEIEKEIYALENKDFTPEVENPLPFSELEYQEKKVTLNELRTRKDLEESKLKIYSQAEASLKSAQNVLSIYKTAYENQLRDIKETEEKIVQLGLTSDKTISDYQTSKANLQVELDKLVLTRPPIFDENLYSRTITEKANCEADIKKLQKDLDLIAQGKCPTCGSVIHTEHKGDIEKELQEKRELLSSLSLKISQLETDRKNVEEKKKEIERIKIQRESTSTRMSGIDSLIDREKTSYSKLKEDLENTLKRLQGSLPGDEKKYQDQSSLVEGEEKSFKELTPPSVNVDYDSQINPLTEEIKTYDDAITLNKKIALDNEKKLKDSEENQKELKKKFDEKLLKIEEAEEWKSVVSILQNEFPNYVISSLMKDIIKEMDSFIFRVYQGRYTILLDETPTGISILYTDGRAKQDVRLASGAEKSIFNTAFKVALSSLSETGLVILDEVDAFFSDGNAKRFFEMIAELTEVFEQVFIITHKEEIKDYLMGEHNAKAFLVSNGEVEEIE